MKLFLTAASIFALSAGSAIAKTEANYDLFTSTDAGKTVIAVAATGEAGPFAAASGADASALDLLAADDANLAVAELRARARPAVKTALETEAAPQSDKTPDADAKTAEAREAHKIVLVKQIKGDDEEASKKEVRRIIKLKTDGEVKDAEIQKLIEEAKADLKGADKDAEIAIEKGVLGADDVDAALLAAAKGGKIYIVENEVDGKATRLVSITGADVAAAKSFIETAKGLDDAEKAAMKTSLGL